MAVSTFGLWASALCLASLVSSAVTPPNSGNPPEVTVQNGTYSGVYSPEYDQDYFFGVPYAQNPTRFRLSESLNATWEDTREVTAYPKHCVGYGPDMIGYEISEDCLYLNVVRPAGLEPGTELPVAVWIHGGGLFMGGSADLRYNLSFIVQNSVELGTPVIGVSINYRLSAFGFIAGEEVRDAGVNNIGFHDQRLALRWVNENIQAFGGSPDKVTIFGESSGAESVSAQTLAYNGRDDGLFRAAIGQSGFGGVLARLAGGHNSTDGHQLTYNTLVASTSCAPLANSSASLDCLRELPFEELNAALNGTQGLQTPWPPVIDDDFIADFPSNQLAEGRFPRIPILIGCNADEGSSFGLGMGPPEKEGRLETDEDFEYAIRTRVIGPNQQTGRSDDDLVRELMFVYPDIQAVGIPNLSRWPAIVATDNLTSQYGLQWRRGGALFGDYVFHFNRRRANKAWDRAGLPSYSYLFDVNVNGVEEHMGSIHFQEVAFVFYNLGGYGFAANPFEDMPESVRDLAKTMNTAWINFFVHGDPNGPSEVSLMGSREWPVYNVTTGGGVGEELVFGENGAYVHFDSWRAEGMNWLDMHGLSVLGN